jgi:divinyl protochlorophyllide a 8-vinyl-reductase
VIQLGEALLARGAIDLARDVYAHAGHVEWLDHPPEVRVEEAAVARLHDALRTCASPLEAEAIARDAGDRTALYLLAHRIPKPAQALLSVAPRRLATALLLRAVAAHAWTFVGSGTLRAHAGDPAIVEIVSNPLQRCAGASRPACVWHEAVFTRLFRALVDSQMEVREVTCRALGRGDVCRFEIGARLTNMRS